MDFNFLMSYLEMVPESVPSLQGLGTNFALERVSNFDAKLPKS